MPRKPDSIINQIAAAVAQFPGRTASELCEILGNPEAYRRLSEVKRLGLAETLGPRICTISGKMSKTWWKADNPAEPDRGQLTPSQEIKRLKARVEHLVNENEKLTQLREHDRRVIEKLSAKVDELCQPTS